MNARTIGHRPRVRRAALAAAAAALIGGAPAEATHPRSSVQFYVEAYGELGDDAPGVTTAREVFARVRAVADKNAKRLPSLVVVDSGGEPWAIALPDGHIVLSRQALEVCRRPAIPTEPCLAFVLGHELAHLANDDFWHQEVHGFLADHPGARNVTDLLRRRPETKGLELAADDKGFIYAAMAGYPVRSLLPDRAPRSGFFRVWTRQANARVLTTHPSPEDRASLLRSRLAAIAEKLHFFEFGVRLSHFDYCDDAIYFLREFQRVFPGREVLNNLGVCHLHLARREMRPQRAYLYWMPLLLDGNTRAAGPVRGEGRPPTSLRAAAGEAGRAHLEQALEYLRLATEADPGYLPAHVNLAVAYLYLGRPHRARAMVAAALELDPQDPAARTLEALALYEQSEPELDLWPLAVKRLRSLAAGAGAPAFATFNLARMLELGSEPAGGPWSRLAERANTLPEPIRGVVCQHHPQHRACRIGYPSTRQPPWRWPIDTKSFIRLTEEEGRRRLPGWQARHFDWYKAGLNGHIYLRPDGEAAVLELDDYVQMQVLAGGPLGRASALPEYCGGAMRRRTMAQGEVWSCGDWAAVTRGDRVEEIWWVAN